jgi:hypothetical protein
MKKTFRFLSMLLVAVATSLAFAACSDQGEDDDCAIDVSYTYGFRTLDYSFTSSLSSNFLVGFEEMQVIENTYRDALGVAGSPFTIHGTVTASDAKVKSICDQAELQLKDRTWSGTYEFVVSNAYTGQSIYTHTFSK